MASLPHFNNDLRITGPYLNKKQDRRFVTIKNTATGKITQKTYAKYLMEVHLGRELLKEETVDHLDRDKLNDVLENFRILPPGQHSSADNVRTVRIKIPCALCGIEMERSAAKMREHATQGHAGPFCGAVCRGKYGASVTHTGKKLPVQKSVQSEYYYPTKE